MAKATRGPKKQNKIDISNLSQRDKDVISMDTKDVMKKYKMQKQPVYDRRFALNKKMKEAGLTQEQVMGGESPVEMEAAPKKLPGKKRGRKKAEPEKVQQVPEEKLSESRDVMVVNKQVPVIMKPIQINFENFSIKLNGVPKKISVNPDTNAIEIDL